MLLKLKGKDVTNVDKQREPSLIDNCSDLMQRKDWNMSLGNLLLVTAVVDLQDTAWN